MSAGADTGNGESDDANEGGPRRDDTESLPAITNDKLGRILARLESGILSEREQLIDELGDDGLRTISAVLMLCSANPDDPMTSLVVARWRPLALAAGLPCPP
jgi:hypothetical protein